MSALGLVVLLAAAAAPAKPLPCGYDGDCPKEHRCFPRRCADQPEASSCMEKVCVPNPGAQIRPSDRTCKEDDDCAVVVLRFQCMYCARPEDFENGLVAAANRKRAKAYEVQPTAEERRQCATAGPCARTGETRARCHRKRCVVEYVPRR